MSTKTLKIPESVHTELKVYIAMSGENMTQFAGLAIMEKLKASGHNFIIKPVNKKRKK